MSHGYEPSRRTTFGQYHGKTPVPIFYNRQDLARHSPGFILEVIDSAYYLDHVRSKDGTLAVSFGGALNRGTVGARTAKSRMRTNGQHQPDQANDALRHNPLSQYWLTPFPTLLFHPAHNAFCSKVTFQRPNSEAGPQFGSRMAAVQCLGV